MKITDITPIVTMPIDGLPWLFVRVDTDEGVYGLGECTDYRQNAHLVSGLEALKSDVVGMDAGQIENVWQTIFHKFDDFNGRGYVSHLISAIDIALWDIKGKVLGAPIYDLLGGPVRDRVPLYTHIQDYVSGAGGPEAAANAARITKADGYEAIKTDPFPSQTDPSAGFSGPAEVERLTPKNLRKSVEWMDAVREVVGPDFELMVDAHARFDVASAIEAGRALEHVNLVWLEEPIHVENHNALRQVRENVNLPLCIGERHFTRWDYTEILANRLVDYIMPDVAWCGGISELRRIAAQAEVQYIRISPHDALGPISIAAGFQVCMTTPNLYRQECLHTWFPVFEQIISPMFDVREGAIFPSDRPGLGIELNMDVVEKYRVNATTREYLNLDGANKQDATGQWIQG
jgi:galactonate dehydratase